MFEIRQGGDRGRVRLDWLDSRHSFSFGDYYDPDHMGFGPLRVINEDRVVPGGGFATHGHKDMEIVTYVLAGALEHKDSLGTGSVIRPGDVQRMTAGAGILHSEFNPSDRDGVHFLQIWILPDAKGLPPGYEQKAFTDAERRGRLRLIASRDGREGSVTVHQDVDLYAAILDDGDSVELALRPGRKAWVQMADGSMEVNGDVLEAGDGAAVEDADVLAFSARSHAEVLVFDMA
jgi:redox-sensitive bicupin YhaK (pirin superfamily)